MASRNPGMPLAAKGVGPKKGRADSAARGTPYLKKPAATGAGSAIPLATKKAALPLQGGLPSPAPSPAYHVGRSLAISQLGEIPAAAEKPIFLGPVVVGPSVGDNTTTAIVESTATVASAATLVVAASDPQAAIPSPMEEAEGFQLVGRKRRTSQGSRPASPKRVAPSSPAPASSSQSTAAQDSPAPKIPPIVVPLCPDWHNLLRTLRNSLPR